MSHWACLSALSVTTCVLPGAIPAQCMSSGMPADLLSQADKIESLEVEQSWKEEEFDFVLQFLRTILMKREPC